MAVPIRLKVFKGDQLVATKDYERDMIKIGRLSTAHLCLDDEKASRIHSVLNVEGDGKLSIVDMGSIEGTYLNGKRVAKGPVQFGDEIRIGATRIVVESAAEAVAQAAAVAEPVSPAPVQVPEPLPAQAAHAPFVAAQPDPAEAFQAPAPEIVDGGRHRTLKIAERPFGTFVPHKPAPRHPSRDAGELGLQIRYYWGDTLLLVTQHREPRPVFVGSSSRSEIKLSAEQVGGPEHALLQPAGDSWSLNLAPGMAGERERNGTITALKGGVHELRAPDFAWVDLGGVRAEFSFAQQPKKVAVPLAERIDYRFLNLLLLFFLVGGAFVITASTHEESDVIADDLLMSKLSVAKFLIKEPEKPKKNKLLEQLAEIKDPQPGEMAERHKGEEGKMGKKDAPINKNNRSAPRAIDINAKDLVKNSGLLQALGSGGGGLSTIFGQGGLGGDIKGALGNMYGTQVGDSGGLGGLGLKGTGTGGGGMGNTIGIGGIGTKGRGGGLGTYGVGVGSLDPKKKTDIGIDDSESVVQGSLDKELIRQVIRRNIGQIRYCYESELQTKPNLAGKVAVRFVIAANGDVQTAKVAEGSTINDARLGECITVRVRSWKFPAPKGGGSVLVTYPFVFKQSGE